MIRFSVKSQSVRFSVRGTEALKMQVEPAVVVYTGGAPYDGPYEVTPTVDAQILATKNKRMSDDLTIEAIPYAEATNSANGKTVTIGG